MKEKNVVVIIGTMKSFILNSMALFWFEIIFFNNWKIITIETKKNEIENAFIPKNVKTYVLYARLNKKNKFNIYMLNIHCAQIHSIT